MLCILVYIVLEPCLVGVDRGELVAQGLPVPCRHHNTLPSDKHSQKLTILTTVQFTKTNNFNHCAIVITDSTDIVFFEFEELLTHMAQTS